MWGNTMKIKLANEEYLEKAKKLTEKEIEQLSSRMRGKLTRRIDDKKLNMLEALAIQLELEDEQLKEWRENRIKINDKFIKK
jgi:hypothetical protein